MLTAVSCSPNRSFVVGSLPLAFTLSPSQLRLISSIGMGVLVGTSLIVIIPEGIETLYSANSVGHKSVHARSSVSAWQVQGLSPRAAPPVLNANQDALVPPATPVSFLPLESETALPVINGDRQSNAQSNLRHVRKEDTTTSNDAANKEEEEKESSPHAWIGVALISGFILMYLIDKVPEFAAPAKNDRTPYHISLDNLGSGLRRNSSPMRDGGILEAGHASSHRSHSFATTTGLVIHAAADGIALGASSSNTGLSFIIFLAIMVHKAPASFGLTSILLKQGLSSRSARAHLLVFSLAAPVGALATFLFAHMVGSSNDASAAHWRTGMLLLFSGGTFL